MFRDAKLSGSRFGQRARQLRTRAEARPHRFESAGEPTPLQEQARRHRGDDVHDRMRRLEREIEHVREIADTSESAWTPAIVAGGVLLIVIPIVALEISIAFAFYFWI